MKKVVLASFVTCAVLAWSLPSQSLAQAEPAPAPTGAQQGTAPASGAAQPGAAPAAGQGQAAAQPACPPMPDAEYKSYTDAMNQTQPQAKAAAIEAYLTAFPNSCYKLPTLIALMQTYAQFDGTKTLATADRVLQLQPDNLQALYAEALLRKQNADQLTDPAAKQTALDQAAEDAQKGLKAPKPAGMSDADFKKLQDAATPSFYSAIGAAAMGKKDTATAIDAYKKELAAVPVDQTTKPGSVLQDTYYLALAYMQSTPPDYLDCAFYAARFISFAPEPYKSQVTPTAKYCYKKYHGADDGFDAVQTAAQANLNPPEGFQASVKPAPTPADIVNQVITSTPDLSTLATGDKEFILQNGTPDQQQKVWDVMKGKSFQFPDVTVISSTPTQVQAAVSDDAVQSKTADFTFNLKPEEEPEHATAAVKAAFKKRQDAIAAAIAPGQKVTLTGTFDSYTQKPFMINMTDAEVVLPKSATKPAATHTAPHHTTTRKR